MAEQEPSNFKRFALKSPNEALQPIIAPEPPPKRRKSSSFLNKISGFFTFAVVIGLIGGGIGYYASNELNATGPLPQDKIVMIAKNSSGDDIIEQLAREKIIEHPSFVSAYIMLKRPKFRAGEYQFKAQSSITEVFDTLVSGKPITHKVTIPEGLTSEQITERLIENDILSGDIADTPKEGSLLPDTYTFERGFTREQMLKSMHAAQEKLVKDIWARRSPDVPLRTPGELVTLASIVEKETGKSDERPHVAGVFINRLNKDMRLQTDPTVVYGIVGGKGVLGRGLTRTELDTPTPYNTYLVKGLPPTPIANPGRAALEAVANPLKSRDIFFVADGKGGHVFAETNEQHSRNVAKWRQIEQTQKDTPPAVITQPDAPSGFAPQTPELRSPELRLPTPQLSPRSEIFVPKAQQQALFIPSTRKSAFDVLALPKSEKIVVKAAPILDQSALNDDSMSNAPRLDDNDNAISADSKTAHVESYPVPSARRTGMKSAANTPPYMDDLPSSALAYQPNEPAKPRSRAFDAVEGTSKDPLRNLSYDLNSPKTVPNLR